MADSLSRAQVLLQNAFHMLQIPTLEVGTRNQAAHDYVRQAIDQLHLVAAQLEDTAGPFAGTELRCAPVPQTSTDSDIRTLSIPDQPHGDTTLPSTNASAQLPDSASTPDPSPTPAQPEDNAFPLSVDAPHPDALPEPSEPTPQPPPPDDTEATIILPHEPPTEREDAAEQAYQLLLWHLRQTKEPESTRDLLQLTPQLEKTEFYDLLQTRDEFVHYRLDPLCNLAGLGEWGPSGWRKAVRARWTRIRKMKPEQLKQLDKDALAAIAHVAEEKQESYIIKTVLRQVAQEPAPTADTEPPINGSLSAWQRWLSSQLPQVQLLGQLNISPEEHQTLADRLNHLVNSLGHTEAIHELETNYPLPLAVFLVFHGVYHSEIGRYWPQVCETLEVPYDNTTSRLGQAFEAILRRYHLPQLEGLHGVRYVRRIVGHGGIPDAALPDFFRTLILPSVTEPDLRNLGVYELAEWFESRAQYLAQSVQWFLQAGERFADDILERCRDMARDALRTGEPQASEFGLPERFTAGLKTALEHSPATAARGPVLPRPYLAFDPWAEGVRIEFPSARLYFEERAKEVVWQVSYGTEVISHKEVCVQHGHELELPAQYLPLGEPAREYRCKILVNQKPVLSVSLVGLSKERPIMLFAPRTGKALGTRVADRQVWILYPAQSQLMVDGRGPAMLEEFPPQWGPWSGYRSCWLELREARSIQLTNPAYTLPLSQEVKLTLVEEPAVSEFGAESGIPVFEGKLPSLRMSLTDTTGWKLQILSDHCNLSFAGTELAQIGAVDAGEFQVALSAVLPEQTAGEYRVVLRGQLGQDSRRVFRFVRALRVARSSTTENFGDVLVEVPPDTALVQDGQFGVPLRKAEARWVYKLQCTPGRSHLIATLEYPRPGFETYRLPLSVPNPQPCWALIGLEQASAIVWTGQPLTVPLHSLEQARAPELLVQAPVACTIRLWHQKADGTEGQSTDEVALDPEKLRGRARLKVGPFLDSLRSGQQANSRLILSLQTRERCLKLGAVHVTRNWCVTNLQVDCRTTGTGHTLHLEWQQDYAARNRRVRIWNLATPWSSPDSYGVPDENLQHLTLSLGVGQYLPGFYQVELYVEDPWLHNAAYTPTRPARNLPQCAVFCLGEELLPVQRSSLGQSGRGCFEAFLLDFERGQRDHRALFPLRESLQAEELEEFVRGLLVLSQDDRHGVTEIQEAIERFFAAALKDRLPELFGMLPQLVQELAPNQQKQVISWLLRMKLSLDPTEQLSRSLSHSLLNATERELLWELWRPLGLFVDMCSPATGRSQRLSQYLGPEWKNLCNAPDLRGWGSCPGQEVLLPIGALKSVWQTLDITPSGPLDQSNLQKCYFLMLLGLLEKNAQTAAARFVEQECVLLEQELLEMVQSGRMLPETRSALLLRHPHTSAGDMKNPLTRLPFVVGSVAAIQRLCAQQGCSTRISSKQLLQQTLQCYEFAPDLFSRDLCHAEIAFREIEETDESDEPCS